MTMKYLKTFENLSESNVDIIDTVEDMLLGLYDDDNKYLVVKYASTDRNCQTKSEFDKSGEKSYNWKTPSYTQDDWVKSMTKFDTCVIYIKPEPEHTYNSYNSDISGNKARVDLDEVKDIIIQIHNYVKSKGYEVKIELEQNLYVTHNGYVKDGDINFYGAKNGFRPRSVNIIINK